MDARTEEKSLDIRLSGSFRPWGLSERDRLLLAASGNSPWQQIHSGRFGLDSQAREFGLCHPRASFFAMGCLADGYRLWRCSAELFSVSEHANGISHRHFWVRRACRCSQSFR